MSNNIHVKYCDSGIIEVIVNTYDNWCDFTFIHHETEDNFSLNEHSMDGGLILHDFSVDLLDGVYYTTLTDQQKNQVHICFIPSDMI